MCIFSYFSLHYRSNVGPMSVRFQSNVGPMSEDNHHLTTFFSAFFARAHPFLYILYMDCSQIPNHPFLPKIHFLTQNDQK